jgi:hypothetical protein
MKTVPQIMPPGKTIEKAGDENYHTTLQPTETLENASGNCRPTEIISIVAGEEYDGPLGPQELKMRFGSPVVESGINYSELATLYSQALNYKKSNPRFREWNARPLSDFAHGAAAADMSYSHRLLALHDMLRKEGFHGINLYDQMVQRFGFNSTERTLRRQVAHARLALIFAVAGKIDLLPSQNVAAVVAAHLPKRYWTAFISISEIKQAESNTVKKAIQAFAVRHGILLKGQPIKCSQAVLPTPLQELSCPDAPPAPGDKVETEIAAIVPPKSSVRLSKTALVKKLAPELVGCVPKYRLRNLEGFAVALINAINAEVCSVPRPGRHPALDKIAAIFEHLDEEKFKRLNQAALRLVIGKAVDEASSQAGARVKKVPSDTPCPKSPEAVEEPFLK